MRIITITLSGLPTVLLPEKQIFGNTETTHVIRNVTVSCCLQYTHKQTTVADARLRLWAEVN